MALIVLSLVGTALYLDQLRREAEDKLARYVALRGAVDVAKTAPAGQREAILEGAARLADQASAPAKPAQIPLEQIEVRIWSCEGAPPENQNQADALVKLQVPGSSARWRRENLRAQTNARSNYRLNTNEIRYNPEEEDAADRLQKMVRDTVGVDAVKVLTFFPTPRSVSVFFCNGTPLAPAQAASAAAPRG
jgi:hypothetical protein